MELDEVKEKYVSILEKNWKKLKVKYGALSIRLGTKFVDKKDTGRPAIVFYVSTKVPPFKLPLKKIIPKAIRGLETDVVELSTEDYELGETSVSKLSPEHQRRLAGGIKKINEE